MTVKEWQTISKQGEPMPATHERFGQEAPPTDRLRLFAMLQDGHFWAAQIRGCTVVAGGLPVGKAADITVEWESPADRKAAEKVRDWLKSLGHTHVYAMPRCDGWAAELGGEG